MYSMRHVKGAAMNLKTEEVEGYKDAMNNWLKNNDFNGVVKNAEKKYTYDHLMVKLIDEHGWVFNSKDEGEWEQEKK